MNVAPSLTGERVLFINLLIKVKLQFLFFILYILFLFFYTFICAYIHKAGVLYIPDDTNETEGGVRAKGGCGGWMGRGVWGLDGGGLQEEPSRVH